MNLLNKITKVFSKPKKEHETPIIDFIIDKITNCEEKPESVDEQEWKSIKKSMLFAFRAKKRKLPLISKGRRNAELIKTKQGFELFEVYIKHL
jgi:hypothetical protein